MRSFVVLRKGWEHETQTTLNFLCDWPPEERQSHRLSHLALQQDAELRHYEIFLEDAHGDVLGSLKVQRRPLRQTYHTAPWRDRAYFTAPVESTCLVAEAICVRDLFRESAAWPTKGVVKQGSTFLRRALTPP